jgi:hypothetical protein
LFGAGQGFNGLLSRSGSDSIVHARQVRLGDLEIQHWLALGLIFGLNDLPGFITVGGLQAGAFAGGFIHAIIYPATDASENKAVSSVRRHDNKPSR